jgi:hypothetical protein
MIVIVGAHFTAIMIVVGVASFAGVGFAHVRVVLAAAAMIAIVVTIVVSKRQCAQ